MDISDKYLVIIVGPTGVGKTDTCIEIAKHLNTEIISADSRQIFKELQIGSAVPESHQLASVKHHLIQTISVVDYYNASMFETDALKIAETLFAKYNIVLMTGGSGMYIDSVCNGIDDIPDIDFKIREELTKEVAENGLENLLERIRELDPEFYLRADRNNTQRIIRALEVCIHTGKPFSSFKTNIKKQRPFKIIKIGLNRDRTELYDRINRRVDKMVAEGLEEEARKVHIFKGSYGMKTVGYKEMFDYFEGKLSLSEAIEHIKNHSRSYARRQLTWFRRDSEIKWFHPDKTEEIIAFIQSQLS